MISAGFEYGGDQQKVHFSSLKKNFKRNFHVVPQVKITEVSEKSPLAIGIVDSRGQT